MSAAVAPSSAKMKLHHREKRTKSITMKSAKMKTAKSKGRVAPPPTPSEFFSFAKASTNKFSTPPTKIHIIRRTRNTNLPIRSYAIRPAVRLSPEDEDEIARPTTSAQIRRVNRLKRKLLKLQNKLPEKAKEISGVTGENDAVKRTVGSRQQTEWIPGFERPTVEVLLRERQKLILAGGVWKSTRDRIKSEKDEMDLILLNLGLPPHNYRKDKAYPVKEFQEELNLETCVAQDFADFYIFPIVLPAIQSLIQFARRNRVFQCRHCTFNALDYVTEYLYNNNPKHPERLKSPVPLYDIPFAKEWILKYPRKPFPKWLTMLPNTAAGIVQRNVRGWLVRKREDVQEMRQFWRDFVADMEEEKRREQEALQPVYSPYYEELLGENDNEEESRKSRVLSPVFMTHSDACLACQRFKEFLHYQEEQTSAGIARATSANASHEVKGVNKVKSNNNYGNPR